MPRLVIVMLSTLNVPRPVPSSTMLATAEAPVPSPASEITGAPTKPEPPSVTGIVSAPLPLATTIGAAIVAVKPWVSSVRPPPYIVTAWKFEK